MPKYDSLIAEADEEEGQPRKRSKYQDVIDEAQSDTQTSTQTPKRSKYQDIIDEANGILRPTKEKIETATAGAKAGGIPNLSDFTKEVKPLQSPEKTAQFLTDFQRQKENERKGALPGFESEIGRRAEDEIKETSPQIEKALREAQAKYPPRQERLFEEPQTRDEYTRSLRAIGVEPKEYRDLSDQQIAELYKKKKPPTGEGFVERVVEKFAPESKNGEQYGGKEFLLDVARNLDIPEKLVKSGYESTSHEGQQAIEAFGRGDITEGTLRSIIGAGHALFTGAMVATPVGLTFTAGLEAAARVAPEATEKASKYLMTPVATATGGEEKGTLGALVNLTDTMLQLYGFKKLHERFQTPDALRDAQKEISKARSQGFPSKDGIIEEVKSESPTTAKMVQSKIDRGDDLTVNEERAVERATRRSVRKKTAKPKEEIKTSKEGEFVLPSQENVPQISAEEASKGMKPLETSAEGEFVLPGKEKVPEYEKLSAFRPRVESRNIESIDDVTGTTDAHILGNKIKDNTEAVKALHDEYLKEEPEIAKQGEEVKKIADPKQRNDAFYEWNKRKYKNQMRQEVLSSAFGTEMLSVMKPDEIAQRIEGIKPAPSAKKPAEIKPTETKEAEPHILSNMPKPLSDKVKEEAQVMLGEIQDASSQKGGIIREVDPRTGKATGEVTGRFGTASSYPEWYQELGRNREDVLKNLQKIVEDNPKNTLALRLIDKIVERNQRGYTDERFAQEVAPDKEFADLYEKYTSGALEKKAGEPIRFEKTPAGEQGILLTEQAKIPMGKKIRETKGTEGTPLFEKEKPKEPEFDTWSKAISESVKRYQEKGLGGQETLTAGGLNPRIIANPKNVKYILEPIINKVKADGLELIKQGKLKAEELVDYVRREVNAFIASSPMFKGTSAQEKRVLMQGTADLGQYIDKDVLKTSVSSKIREQQSTPLKQRERIIERLKSTFDLELAEEQREAELNLLKADIQYRDKLSSEKGNTQRAKGRLAVFKEAQKRVDELEELRRDIEKREVKNVKQELVDYLKENLPVSERGRFIGVVKSATNRQQLAKAFSRIDEVREAIEKKGLVGDIKTAVDRIVDSPSIAVDYRERIKQLVSDIQLKGVSEGRKARLQNTKAFIERQRSAGADVEMPRKILEALDVLSKKPVSEMSIAEVQTLLGKIEDLEQLGKTKQKTIENLYHIEKQRKVKEIVEGGVVPLEQNEILRKPGEKLTIKEQIGNAIARIQNVLRRTDLVITDTDALLDIMDGGKAKFDGPMFRIFKGEPDQHFYDYLNARDKAYREVVEKSATLNMNQQNFERIGIHAARVQENGVEKLLNTGLTQEQIDAVKLTPQETEIYNLMRKRLDELRPQIADVLRKEYNKELGKEENYFSFLTDWEAMNDAEIFERFGSGVKDFSPRKKNPEMGFTKERTGAGQQKIKLDAMRIYRQHMDNAYYMINMAHQLRIMSDVAKDPKVGEAIGDLGRELLLKYTDVMARKGGAEQARKIEALDWLRKNAGVAQLGFKVSSALIQPTALFDGATMIGGWAFRGLQDVALSKDIRKFIVEHMPEVRDRIGDDPAFLELSDKTLFQRSQQGSLAPLKALDKMTASGVAWGAYLKKLKELGVEADMSKPNPEALTYAQMIVRKTQSSSLFKDAPLALSRGALTGNRSFDRAFFQFQSFMLTRWSLIRNNAIRAGLFGGRGELKERDFGKVYSTMFYLTLAAIAENGIRTGVNNATTLAFGGKEEEIDYTDKAVNQVLGTIPFVSQLYGIARYGGGLIPVVEQFEGLERIGGLGSKDTRTKIRAATDVAKTVGAVVGVPGSSQAAQIIKKLAAPKKKVAGRSVTGQSKERIVPSLK